MHSLERNWELTPVPFIVLVIPALVYGVQQGGVSSAPYVRGDANCLIDVDTEKAGVSKRPNDGITLRTQPVISGNLRPFRDWGPEEWTRELEFEKAIGFDLLWLSHPQQAFQAPGSEDRIKTVLDVCEKLDMQLILSTGSTKRWHNSLNVKHEIENVGSRITLIGNRYGDHPSFFGWYIPHEIYFAEGDLGHYIERLYPSIVQQCKTATPDKPVTLSPFFILDKDQVFGDFRYVTPREYCEYWTRIIKLSGIDIIMMQDSGEHFSYVTNEQRRPFYAAMQKACQATGARFWANVEVAEAVCPSIEEYRRLYGRIHHSEAVKQGLPWREVPIDRLANKLSIAAEYCERIVSWGYFQYGRPELGSDASKWYEGYRSYYKAITRR